MVSNVFFDPAVSIRIATTTLTIATLIGVVAAGITVGVIVSRQSDGFVQKTIVLRSDVTVAVSRPLTNNELEYLNDPTGSCNNMSNGIDKQAKDNYPADALRAVGNTCYVRPGSTNGDRRKRQSNTRTLIVTISGSIYFRQSHTGDQIRAAFSNYTQTIVLSDIFNAPSPGTGAFSSKYSTFTDTYPTNLAIDQVNALNSAPTTVTASPG